MHDPREIAGGSPGGVTGGSRRVSRDIAASRSRGPCLRLNDLRSTEPTKARLAAEAVIALLDENQDSAPHCSHRLGHRSGCEIGVTGLTAPIERQLEPLTRARRGLAGVATSRKQLEREIAQLEMQVTRLADQRDRAVEAGREDLAQEASSWGSGVKAPLEEASRQALRPGRGRGETYRGLRAAAGQGGRLQDPQGDCQGQLSGGASGAGRGRRAGQRRRAGGSRGAPDAQAREAICATLRAVEELLGSDCDVERAAGAETGALVKDRGIPTPGPVTPGRAR